MGGSSRYWILGIGAIAFGAVLIFLGLWVVGGFILHLPYSPIFLSGALISAGLITFFGSLWHSMEGDRKLDGGDMRTAITVSIVTVYLVLVSVVVFFTKSVGFDELSKIAEMLLTSFTALVSIVVPFYFGASAYVQVKDQSKKEETD